MPLVTVAEFPVTLIPQVPLAPVPVGEGTSVPIAKPRFVLAAEAVVAAVPPLATGKVPVTPAVKDSPEQLVNVPEEGVPRAPPLVTNAPAEPTLTAKAVATLVPRPDTPVAMGKLVQLVRVPEAGVPRIGEVRVGDAKVGDDM